MLLPDGLTPQQLQVRATALLREATAVDKKLGGDLRKRMLKMVDERTAVGDVKNADILRIAANS
jgi:hypothetical protein